MRLGKSQSAIANKIRLLRLSPEHRQRIVNARLTERHARALLKLDDGEKREEAINAIIAKEMNVQESEQYIEKLLNPVPEEETQRHPAMIRDVRLFVNTITRAVETMRESGLDARTSTNETDDYIEYTVFIPKNTVKKKRGNIRRMG